MVYLKISNFQVTHLPNEHQTHVGKYIIHGYYGYTTYQFNDWVPRGSCWWSTILEILRFQRSHPHTVDGSEIRLTS